MWDMSTIEGEVHVQWGDPWYIQPFSQVLRASSQISFTHNVEDSLPNIWIHNHNWISFLSITTKVKVFDFSSKLVDSHELLPDRIAPSSHICMGHTMVTTTTWKIHLALRPLCNIMRGCASAWAIHPENTCKCANCTYCNLPPMHEAHMPPGPNMHYPTCPFPSWLAETVRKLIEKNILFFIPLITCFMCRRRDPANKVLRRGRRVLRSSSTPQRTTHMSTYTSTIYFKSLGKKSVNIWAGITKFWEKSVLGILRKQLEPLCLCI